MKKVNILFKILFFFFIISYCKHSDSFSQVSLGLMKKLNDVVVVNVFISDDLPPQYGSLKSDVIKILTEYEKLSDGKLIIEKYEGKPNSYIEDQADKNGILPLQVQFLSGNEIDSKKVYLGLSFSYQGRQDIIPVVASVSGLEYKINKILYYFTLDKKKKIGLLKGHGESDYSKWIALNKILSEHYEIVDIDLSEFNSVPEDIEVIIIIAPNKIFPESHKFMIDQFIMRGGNVAWLINKVVPDVQKELIIGDIVLTNLDDMLLNYGIKINDDLVRDLTCAQISLPTQTPGFAIPVPYQYFPLVSGISSEIPGFDNISSIALPYVSSLDLEQAQGKEVTAKPLLTSSDKSGRDEGFFILNPDRFNNLTSIARDTLFALKGIVLGAVYTGKFKSFYAGKQISEDTSKNFIRTYSGNVLEESKKESKMLVIGDGDFPNELNKPPKDNLIFFNDIIEYLAIEINLNETTKNQ